jgi:hypothetical protein
MDRPPHSPPDALLLLAPGCPHCPAALESLTALLKEGLIGRLQIVNIAVHPESASALGVRTVPWTRIGHFELDGALTPAELRRWAEAASHPDGSRAYCFEMLKSGRRDKVERLIRTQPEQAVALAELLRDPDSSMAVRLGIGAVLEEFHGSGLTESLIPALAALSQSGDRLTRADACHFLTLIGGAAILPHLRACLADENQEVREIAQEALTELGHEAS